MKLKFNYYSILLISALLVVGISCDDDDDNTDVDEIGAVTLDLVTEGLASPLVVVESTDNTGRLFIADQSGQIYIVKDGTRLSQPFLDITSKVIPR